MCIKYFNILLTIEDIGNIGVMIHSTYVYGYNIN